MLRSGKEHLEFDPRRAHRIYRLRAGRRRDATSCVPQRRADGSSTVRHESRSRLAGRNDLRGRRRASLRLFFRARSRDDLQRRMIGHRRIADFTYGMFGRSPDHVSSFVTGMAMKADELKPPCGHPDNLLAYYRHIRDNDITGLCGSAAAGCAQSGILSSAEPAGANVARRARGRQWRDNFRHEDAGNGRFVRQRHLDRQRHSARTRSEKRGDYLRHPLQRSGPATVVAATGRGQLRVRIRFTARLPVRRERQHVVVRRGEGAVGACFRA